MTVYSIKAFQSATLSCLICSPLPPSSELLPIHALSAHIHTEVNNYLHRYVMGDGMSIAMPDGLSERQASQKTKCFICFFLTVLVQGHHLVMKLLLMMSQGYEGLPMARENISLLFS